MVVPVIPPSAAGRRIRVGIDVGGTFTDVVAVDAATRQVVGQLKVPTTHRAADGVARGIVEAIQGLAARLGLDPTEVVFLAHATTQATNALLEGDVAEVGVIGLGDGLEGWKARLDTRVPPIPLAPSRQLVARHRFFHRGRATVDVLADAVEALARDGVRVVVVSAAFGVDDPARETAVADLARARGLLATCGHEVSSLYGLRTRTRTAVLNGALLPRMLETAQLTAQAAARAGIRAPLMIMRSDGGVMSLDEVARRPILTMLSGPAAGVAGALMYERVSDGIFIEVGGTSADISVIRDGRPQMRPARIGGHRTFLDTLDVRTVGVAGGSLIRRHGQVIAGVGPRSAHIAGLPYAAFTPPAALRRARLVHVRPTPQDSDDYVAIESDGARFALTPTCAANLLGLVPAGAFAYGSTESAALGFAPLAAALGLTPEAVAERVLEVACLQIVEVIRELLADYHIEKAPIELVGGGGGAAALVPFAARLLKRPFRLAAQAEYISTIGVALAMVRDTVERNIVNPSPGDVLRIRREAAESAIRSGARPETVEVQVEVDTRRALVRATAFGTTEFRSDDAAPGVGEDECLAAASRAMGLHADEVRGVAATRGLRVFAGVRTERRWRWLTRHEVLIRVTDATGVVRLQRTNGRVRSSSVRSAQADLERTVAALTEYGDAGRALPDVHLLAGARIVNLSGLATAEQMLALAQVELEGLPDDEPVVIVAGTQP